ncbi:hypothetical protein [Roseomonas rosulenta]|uniref:hypothetical protein n=1 Tax=Roseomonas rosulenta TaxID=2748667 RepID=UPI0018DF05F4|nr:hypothetical protein [Roseomonas rosulenta]
MIYLNEQSRSSAEHPAQYGDDAALAHGQQQHDGRQHYLDPTQPVVGLLRALGATSTPSQPTRRFTTCTASGAAARSTVDALTLRAARRVP